MHDDWRYLSKGGAWLGPVSIDALQALLNQGVLNPQSSVWQVGVEQWTRLLHIPQFERANKADTGSTSLIALQSGVLAIEKREASPATGSKTDSLVALSQTDHVVFAAGASPIRRFLCRWTEISFFSFVLFCIWPLLKLIPHLPQSVAVYGPVIYVSVFFFILFFNSVSYFLFGNTLFKNLFSLQVHTDQGARLSAVRYFLRECRVFCLGIGVYLPAPPFWGFLMWRQYAQLKAKQFTVYDTDTYHVRATPLGVLSFVLLGLLLFVLFSFHNVLSVLLSLYKHDAF